MHQMICPALEGIQAMEDSSNDNDRLAPAAINSLGALWWGWLAQLGAWKRNAQMRRVAA